MTEVKDKELIEELTKATKEGKIRWIPTAKLNEFTASFRGKYSVVIGEDRPGGVIPGVSETVHYLVLEDESGRILHRLQHDSIRLLIESARRSAFHADRAIDEIIVDLKSR